MARKGKAYKQQKKFYDESNDYNSLGEIFLYWLECGNMTAKQMQETYREGDRECREHLISDVRYLTDIETFHTLVNIFLFGHK